MVVDWDSIGEMGFWAADRAATNIARSIPGTEPDDIFQEAVLYLATHREEVDGWAEYGYNRPGPLGGEDGARRSILKALSKRLRQSLRRESDKEALRVAASREEPAEAVDLTRWGNRPTPPDFEGLDYTPAVIEAALPMVWDESRAGKLTNERAPEPGAPRAASDPSKSGTGLAIYADITRAWSLAELTHEQRQALVLFYGMGMTLRGAGQALGGLHHLTVTRMIDRGLEALAAVLNGRHASLTATLEPDPEPVSALPQPLSHTMLDALAA